MKREIKFRVWDKTKGCYVLFDLKDMFHNTMKHTIAHHAGKPTYISFRQEDFVFQQYTGMKDKNSKEIYEGDIINEYYDRLRGYVADFSKSQTDITDGLWTYGNFTYTSVVYWSETYHGFNVKRFIDGKEEDAHMFPLNGSNVEIVGNIFENPELCEK